MGLETGSTPAQRPLMRLKRLYGEPPNGIIFPPKPNTSFLACTRAVATVMTREGPAWLGRRST